MRAQKYKGSMVTKRLSTTRQKTSAIVQVRSFQISLPKIFICNCQIKQDMHILLQNVTIKKHTL